MIYTHILPSLLLLIVSKKRLTVTCFVAVGLVVLPSLHTHFRFFTERKYADSTRTPTQIYDQVAGVLTYDANATSRWCNTVLMDVNFYDGLVTTIPAGFGTSVFFDIESLSAIQSQYLWITDSTRDALSRRIPQPRLMDLLAMPRGKLYRNQDADCRDPSSRDHLR